jgi:hypothetical protein
MIRSLFLTFTASSASAATMHCFHSFRDRHLGGGQETGAEAGPLGPEGQCRGEPPAVGDAACGDHGYLPGDVDDLRDQHHRRDEPAVPAGLASLGDNHVRARLYRLHRLPHVHDLLKPQDPGVVCLGDQVTGHRQVERHDRRPELHRGRERLLNQGARRVVDRERPARQPAQPRPLVTQLPHRPQRRPHAAQRPRLAHRRGQLDLFPRPERRADDGHVDPEQVAKRGAQHGRPPGGSMTGLALVRTGFALIRRPRHSPAIRSPDVTHMETA